MNAPATWYCPDCDEEYPWHACCSHVINGDVPASGITITPDPADGRAVLVSGALSLPDLCEAIDGIPGVISSIQHCSRHTGRWSGVVEIAA